MFDVYAVSFSWLPNDEMGSWGGFLRLSEVRLRSGCTFLMRILRSKGKCVDVMIYVALNNETQSVTHSGWHVPSITQIYLPPTRLSHWLRGTVVERRSLAGELSLSCARPIADR